MKKLTLALLVILSSCLALPKSTTIEELMDKGRNQLDRARAQIAQKEDPTESLNNAINYFSLVVDKDPNFSAEVYLLRGQSYELKGDLENAIKDYTKSLHINKSTPAYMGRGRVLARKAVIKSQMSQETPEEFDLAIIDFKEALEMELTLQEAWFGRAKALVDKIEFLVERKKDASKEIDQAMKDLDKAIGLNRSHAPSFLVRGQLFLLIARVKSRKNEDYTKDIESAIEELKSSIVLDPTDERPYFLVGVAELELARLKVKALRDRETIVKSLNNAIQYLKDSLGLRVSSSAYASLGMAYVLKSEFEMDKYQAEQVDLAIEAFKNSLQLSPSYEAYFNKAICHNYRALVMLKKGFDPLVELNSAVECYSNAIAIRQEFDAYYKRGLSYLEIASYNKGRGVFAYTDFKKALSDLEEAIRINPAFPKALLSIGISAYYCAEYDRSIDALTKYLISDPENLQALGYRGHAYMQRGKIGKRPSHDFMGAAADFEKITKKKPRDAQAYINIGLAYFYNAEFKMKSGLDPLGDLDTAIKAYDVAKEIDPANYNARFNAGTTWYVKAKVKISKQQDASTELSKAIDNFTAALTLRRDEPEGHSALGSSYYLLGDRKKALENWNKAVSLDARLKSDLEPWIKKVKDEIEKPPSEDPQEIAKDAEKKLKEYLEGPDYQKKIQQLRELVLARKGEELEKGLADITKTRKYDEAVALLEQTVRTLERVDNTKLVHAKFTRELEEKRKLKDKDEIMVKDLQAFVKEYNTWKVELPKKTIKHEDVKTRLEAEEQRAKIYADWYLEFFQELKKDTEELLKQPQGVTFESAESKAKEFQGAKDYKKAVDELKKVNASQDDIDKAKKLIDDYTKEASDNAGKLRDEVEKKAAENKEEAVKMFKEADPRFRGINADIDKILDELINTLSKEEKITLESVKAQVDEAIKNKDYKKAVNLLRKVNASAEDKETAKSRIDLCVADALLEAATLEDAVKAKVKENRDEAIKLFKDAESRLKGTSISVDKLLEDIDKLINVRMENVKPAVDEAYKDKNYAKAIEELKKVNASQEEVDKAKKQIDEYSKEALKEADVLKEQIKKKILDNKKEEGAQLFKDSEVKFTGINEEVDKVLNEIRELLK